MVNSAAEHWNTFPHCNGYPTCDGDLPGEAHSESCPLFGKIEITTFEFADSLAAAVRAEERQRWQQHIQTVFDNRWYKSGNTDKFIAELLAGPPAAAIREGSEKA